VNAPIGNRDAAQPASNAAATLMLSAQRLDDLIMLHASDS
jgi:hypothetical protein